MPRPHANDIAFESATHSRKQTTDDSSPRRSASRSASGVWIASDRRLARRRSSRSRTGRDGTTRAAAARSPNASRRTRHASGAASQKMAVASFGKRFEPPQHARRPRARRRTSSRTANLKSRASVTPTRASYAEFVRRAEDARHRRAHRIGRARPGEARPRPAGGGVPARRRRPPRLGARGRRPTVAPSITSSSPPTAFPAPSWSGASPPCSAESWATRRRRSTSGW